MRRGVATFTLDYGKCPPWLWQRMVKLGREMVRVLVEEYGPDEFIKRIADPVWFQSLGTVLAFDWNASGLTTILTASLKESIKGMEQELGIFICGGKGKASRKTPDEIIEWGYKADLPELYATNLVYNSRMSAKVDSALIQDGFQIYHHAFFFSKHGAWAVVQQGMNTVQQSARRYHWFSEHIQDLIQEPHNGIVSDSLGKSVLDMTSKQSDSNRSLSLELVDSGYENVMKDIQILRKHSSHLSRMVALQADRHQLTFLELVPKEFGPADHPVVFENFSKSKYLEKILFQVTEQQPKTYEEFVGMAGVGPKTVRALSLASEVIYGAKPSYEDPARYSYAHGGKDMTPFPVDRSTYDEVISILKNAVGKARIDAGDKQKMLKRLSVEEMVQ